MKNAGKKITIPLEVATSDNLVDASTNALELVVNPDGNLQPVDPETTETTESTETISDEVATDLIPANADELETMVELVADSNETAIEEVLEGESNQFNQHYAGRLCRCPIYNCRCGIF